MTSKISIVAFLALLSFKALTAQNAPQYEKASIDELINAMTPEEKAKLLVGPGMPGYAGLVPLEGEPDVRVLGEAGGNDQIPRLGIPETVFADGPAGLRIEPKRQNDPNTYYATAFPVGTALASTWNTDLIESVGEAMGEEVKEYGVDVLLAPALNIHRNPLNGRNFEYYSEDPLVAGKIASAYIKGIQSHDVGTSIKHFAANNQETNRLAVNAHISERAMREIYLRGFEIAIKESKPWTVMTAYNKLNGTYASANKDLLTTILRDEWGYEGLVMTDWFGGYPGFESILEEGSVSDVVAQINAGNDLLMPGTEAQREALAKAIEEGTVNEEAVNASLRRILEYIRKSPTTDNYKFSNKPDLEAHAEVTRKVAAEGMILLKNEDNVLPFTDKSGSIAVFGDHSYSFIAGGTGSGDVNEAYSISLLQGLDNAGYTVDEELQNLYEPFVAQAVENENKRREEIGLLADNKRLPEMLPEDKLVEAKAKSADVAVITLGRNSGEQFDRKIDDDFYLGQDEVKLINTVTEAFHAEGKKVIVILNIGGVIETASWKDKVDAILLAWQPGQEGGNSVADVFSGEVNPSGKLTMTFPIDYNHHASAANWLGEPIQKPTDVYYKEGIYIGYRYFDTFDVKSSYEFGYGSSYTTFEYSDIKLSTSNFEDELEVSVKVTNTGNVAGKEIVQLYVSAPANLVDKPSQELKAFGKTKTLKPGKSEILKFTLSPKDLASFVDAQSAWIAEKGTYTLKIGASSLDIKLKDEFEVSSNITAEKVNNTFDLDTEMPVLKN
ncbi:glycoside hydrolase family 3 C-terminal domain-containing protein [Zunongwangia sp. SCSIO 43204]|uniref:beta-glucosidase family protein n=1 Tax=Zunongwangia sp. SCSIO 43204 TaxID=2779359 RepID=UPI001CA82F0F|nr:glycoside hydrolase family 3 N-terminal domain-containing protein [Zunongwangia sp. SCSIO 43204]UAB84449.1 glycoside hydrolase family 3 C-terminal domain-containing protein [Zunongwangia sp. SCSIO 43204]